MTDTTKFFSLVEFRERGKSTLNTRSFDTQGAMQKFVNQNLKGWDWFFQHHIQIKEET